MLNLGRLTPAFTASICLFIAAICLFIAAILSSMAAIVLLAAAILSLNGVFPFSFTCEGYSFKYFAPGCSRNSADVFLLRVEFFSVDISKLVGLSRNLVKLLGGGVIAKERKCFHVNNVKLNDS